MPAYRHRPGQTPHPLRDPRGHSYGAAEPAPPRFDPATWSSCDDYLFGVDLYNLRYYWEAHEAWEGLWKTTGRKDRPGRFLQGLIQVAAAFLKDEMGVWEGARKLSAKGLVKLRIVESSGSHYCGLALAKWCPRVEDHFAGSKRGSPPVPIELSG